MEKEDFRTVRGIETLLTGKEGLSWTLEDYLEMITRVGDGVRIGELSERLNVNPSSASKMAVKLAVQGCVEPAHYGQLRLTKKGRRLGEYLIWRHEITEEFFALFSQGESALYETELSEHILSTKTLENMEKFVEFLKNNHDIRDDLKKLFSQGDRNLHIR